MWWAGRRRSVAWSGSTLVCAREPGLSYFWRARRGESSRLLPQTTRLILTWVGTGHEKTPGNGSGLLGFALVLSLSPLWRLFLLLWWWGWGSSGDGGVVVERIPLYAVGAAVAVRVGVRGLVPPGERHVRGEGTREVDGLRVADIRDDALLGEPAEVHVRDDAAVRGGATRDCGVRGVRELCLDRAGALAGWCHG